MLDRIEISMHQLHTITDSLAHDLRSPLTAIRGKLNDGVNFESGRQALIEEVLKSAETEVTPHELEKVKNKVEAEQVFNEIGYLEKAMQLAAYEILGDAGQINRQADHYRNVSADDIRKVASGILRPENCNLLNYLSLKK